VGVDCPLSPFINGDKEVVSTFFLVILELYFRVVWSFNDFDI
jgi:hypothetical protein